MISKRDFHVYPPQDTATQPGYGPSIEMFCSYLDNRNMIATTEIAIKI